jgi:hypothetical protein
MPRANLPQPDYLDLCRLLGPYQPIEPLDKIMEGPVMRVVGVDPGSDSFSITAVSYNSKTGTVTDVTSFTEIKNNEGQ